MLPHPPWVQLNSAKSGTGTVPDGSKFTSVIVKRFRLRYLGLFAPGFEAAVIIQIIDKLVKMPLLPDSFALLAQRADRSPVAAVYGVLDHVYVLIDGSNCIIRAASMAPAGRAIIIIVVILLRTRVCIRIDVPPVIRAVRLK